MNQQPLRNVWQYLAGVYNGSQIINYLDASAGTPVAYSTAIPDNAGALIIGAYVSTSYTFHGVIDEVRISNIARSASWIKATYNSLWDSLVTFSTEASIEASISGTYYPLAESDDGSFTKTGTTSWFNSANPTIRLQGSAGYYGFIRFNNINILPGSTINSAYIRFKADWNDSDSMNLSYYGNDVDDAVAPTDVYVARSLTLTTAHVTQSMVAWTTGSFYNSDDLSTIIQEVIDRAGWLVSDYAITIIMQPDTGNRSFVATGYVVPAELHIDWTEPTDQAAIFAKAGIGDTTLVHQSVYHDTLSEGALIGDSVLDNFRFN